MQDALLETLNAIKEFAKENKIVILRGSPLGDSKFISIPLELEKGDWKGFFQVILDLGLKGVNMFVYKIQDGVIEEEMRTYCSKLQGEKKDEYIKAMRDMEKSIGLVESITLSFFYPNVRYVLEIESKLTEIQDLLWDAFCEDADDTVEMTEEQLEGIAKLIARDDRYIKASRGEKADVALELIDENEEIGELSEEDSFQITWRAKRYFDKEVQPELDKELEKEILKLKRQKVSKTAAKGILKISEGRINRFWYN